MAKAPPAFQFYPEDFMGGTSHLDAQAIGCYLLLLCFQWCHGRVPKEHDKRARICKMTPQDFTPIWGELEDKFFTDEEGQLFNHRLEVVRERQLALSEKRREAGRKGGQAIASNLLKQKAKQKQSPLKVEGRRQKVEENKEEKEEILRIDNDRLRQAACDWIEYKAEKRQPYKPQGLKALVTNILNESASRGVEGAVADIEGSMGANYTGIVWGKYSKGKNHDTRNATHEGTGAGQTRRGSLRG